MITKKTAYEICLAYSEIENGEKLIADLKEALEKRGVAELRDVFGRPRGLTLGVPSGNDCQRIFDVAPTMGMAVIGTHVAQKRAELVTLNERAKAELL